MQKNTPRHAQKLKKQLDSALSYAQWQERAQALDALEHRDVWKQNIASDIYNYELLSDRLTELKHNKGSLDLDALSRGLREGLHHDLGNMGDRRLYQQCHAGTKVLIEDYVTVVCECLELICESDMRSMPAGKKLDFFKDILLSFGRPALLLSGGASLGAFHIGVVKALWEQDLLPQVITGSSSGAIIAATLGTHSDDELPALFDPHLHKQKAWQWLGLTSGLKGRGFMDQKQLQDYIRGFVGEYTMQEAYEKTGRSINISVSPIQHHQKARLLSGYTSPYILMWSAALASSAVPAIFPPVKLLKKDQDGRQVPYMPRLRWVDGSVVSDLPIERLMHLYDVNYSIVSQTNPHIVPFLDQPEAQTKGLLTLPKKWLKAELKFHGKAVSNFIRNRSESEILRQISGQVYSMMDQRYNGDVTIAPHYKLRHYAKVMSNPDPKFIQELILEGERATWPKISMIRTHAKISKTLEKCIAKQKELLRSHRGTLSVIA